MSDSDSALTKRQWRHQLKAIRQMISANRKNEASQSACEALYHTTLSFNYVLSFASFGSEINLNPFNEKLAYEKRLILPRTTEESIQLFLVENLETLETHLWGMREPNPTLCEEIEPSQILLALIPGLGFDLVSHHRLGYGRGYYDRLLLSLNQTETWGIGFKEQQVNDLPFEAQDMALTEIKLF